MNVRLLIAVPLALSISACQTIDEGLNSEPGSNSNNSDRLTAIERRLAQVESGKRVFSDPAETGAGISAAGSAEIGADMDRMRNEVRFLRGQVEEQRNEIRRLRTDQSDLLRQINTRIASIESQDRAPVGNTSSAPPPARPPQDVAKLYQSGLNLMRAKRYAEARDVMRRVVTDHPNSSRAANAQYWLAETYYVTRELDPAEAEFQKVLSDFPGSSKSADATLKMAFIARARGNASRSRELLNTVVEQYPSSRAATIAKEKLAKLP